MIDLGLSSMSHTSCRRKKSSQWKNINTHTHTRTHTHTNTHTYTHIHIHKLAPLFQKPLIKGYLLVKKFRSQIISNQLFPSLALLSFFTLSGQFFDFVPILSATPKRRKKSIEFLDSELYVEFLSVEHQWWLHQVLYCGDCLYQLPH